MGFVDQPVWPPMYKPATYDVMVFTERGANGVHYYAMDSVGHVFCVDSPTSCIQEAINYVSSNYGQGLIYVRGGTYHIPTNGVTVNAPIIIVGEGDKTNIVLGGVNAITNNGPYLKFKNLQISSYTNNQVQNSQQIYSSSGDLVFEDVDFYVPIDMNGGSFIYANAGDVWFIRGRLKQGGSLSSSWFVFAQSDPSRGGSASIHVRDFNIDSVQNIGSGRYMLKIFSFPDGDVDGVIVRSIGGNVGYLTDGVKVVRNIKLFNAALNVIYINNSRIVENIEHYGRANLDIIPDTAGLISNVSIYNPLALLDLGYPSSGVEARVALNNIYLGGSTISFGGYRYVEMNNVVCDNSCDCLMLEDYNNSGNPVNLLLNNVSLFLDGTGGGECGIITVDFLSVNLKTVFMNNCHLYAKYNPNTQYIAYFLYAESSSSPYSNDTLIQVSNSSIYTEKPRSQGGPYIYFIDGDYRAYETQVVRVVNSTIYTEAPLPFGYWSQNTPWGTPLGRYDRITNALILNNYDWSPYSSENINVSSSVSVGTGGSYGPAWVVQAPGGAFKDFDIAITWGGTFASGETVTVQIQVEYDDGSTNSITVSSSSTGTTWLTPAQKAQLFASNKSIVRIYISAASNESSTSVTVTAQVIGSS